MLRTHNCGELRIENVGNIVTLTGWVQKIRDKGGMIWIDVRDRYGITQLIFDESKSNPEVVEIARTTGREFVLQAQGEVIERISKNDKIATGDIEIFVNELKILNKSKVPPFTIEEETDGGEDIRMKYRYLDLRRRPLKENLLLRHRIMQETRNYFSNKDFIEVETPFLIKSTPEGARDFVVPSRISEGEFYALPQSPQTFKQLLMVSGFDRYFQIVRCFRDEDLRADRQPEFTQIDCEMSFVTREDIMHVFEGMMKHLFKTIKDIELDDFPVMQYNKAIEKYGSDKPDIRFGMTFHELNDLAKGKGFNVFDNAQLVVGIKVDGAADWSRKQLDALTDFVRRPQVGAKGLVYVKYNQDGSFKSSVDKFFSQEDLGKWSETFGAKPNDLLLILAGESEQTRKALSELRLKLGEEMGLRDNSVFAPLWIVDFPLLEWDEESQRYYAMHHPFTSPNPGEIELLETEPGKVNANAYDMVINGVELGGGSIRIHDKEIQQKMFRALGFSPEEARAQFGFLLDAFEYGAPPHGGIAFGFDRICALFGGTESIRDYIAFPKNNSARDVMIDAPSPISGEQLEELHIQLRS
jgi:aspartyl-tRNA synthetase